MEQLYNQYASEAVIKKNKQRRRELDAELSKLEQEEFRLRQQLEPFKDLDQDIVREYVTAYEELQAVKWAVGNNSLSTSLQTNDVSNMNMSDEIAALAAQMSP